jgi:hypothetical protein
MNFSRVALVAVAGCTLLLNPLRAQSAAPWAPDKQYSTEQVMTTKDGMTMNMKVYVDSGKMRTETNMRGMAMTAIVLPADKIMYTVMEAQHMVMQMPLSDAKAKQMAAATGGGGANFQLVGPDTVDGTACTKYKMTAGTDPKVFDWWINTATKTPVKMAAEDGSFTLTWKNYKAGPQDPSLFQPPAGYQIMQMPGGMSMPGGGAPSGGQ